jgi:hypothetical protein
MESEPDTMLPTPVFPVASMPREMRFSIRYAISHNTCPGPLMSEDLVTIATYWMPIEADLARNALELEEIRAFVCEAATVSMVWYYGNALGGCKLMVSSADALRAIEVLDSADQQDAPLDPEDEFPRVSAVGQLVDRAYLAAGLGIKFMPLQLYSMYLLLLAMAACADGQTLPPRRFRRAVLACILIIPNLTYAVMIFL